MRVKLFLSKELDTLSKTSFLKPKPCSLALIPWDSPSSPAMSISCCTTCPAKPNKKSGTSWHKLLFKLMPWAGLSVAAPISTPKRLWSSYKSIHLLATTRPKEGATTRLFMTLWYCTTLISRTGKRQKIFSSTWLSTLKTKMPVIHHQLNLWKAGSTPILLCNVLFYFLNTFSLKKDTTKTLAVDLALIVCSSWLLLTSRSLKTNCLRMKDRFSWISSSFTVKNFRTNLSR